MMVAMPAGFSTQSPFVGRAADLDRLAAMIGIGSPQSAAGPVLLAGEAGVGKTRLLEELRARASKAGWRVTVGHCVDFGDSAPSYLPFKEVFGRLASESPAFADSLTAAWPALRVLMPGRLTGDGSGGPAQSMDRAELFQAVHAGLSELGRAAPLLVVIEDVHWADRSTRELLSFLFARPFAEQVSVIASYRSDDLHRRHPLRSSVGEWVRLPGMNRLQLGPLADAEVRALIHVLHPAPIPAGDVQAIVKRAEGNPFFVEELVVATEGGSQSLPADISDLLLVRLDQLDEPVRQVVRAASAAGRSVSHELLAQVVGADAASLDRSLRAAVEANVLVTAASERYAFRHALLAEVIYNDLLPGERVRLHGAYTRVLSEPGADGSAAELARHARGAHDTATATRASIQAGDEAMALGGPDEAARHYEHALELVHAAAPGLQGSAGGDVVGLVLRATDAAMAAGHVFRALALAQDQLGHLAADVPADQRARLLQAVAKAALVVDTGIDILKVTAEALKAVPAEASPLRAQLLGVHARANADRHRDDEAARWAGEALALARQLQLPEVTADAATTLAGIEKRAGDPDSSQRSLLQTVSDARAAGEIAAELRGLFNLGALNYELGRLPEALAAFRSATGRAAQNGRPWAPWGIDARVMAGVAAYVRGDWDEVLQITDVSGESPPAMAEATLAAVSMAVAAGRGDRRAIELLPRLRPWWEHDGLIAVLSGAAAIDAYGDRGELEAAISVHDDVVACVSELWQFPSFPARIRFSGLLVGQLCAEAARGGSRRHGELAEQAGELAGAAAAAAGHAAALGRPRGRESDAWMARLTAEHGRLRWLTDTDPPAEEELLAAWQRSVAAFQLFGHRFEAARSQARLAAVLRSAGHPAEAADLARQARDTARQLSARPLLDELRTLGPLPARRRPEVSRKGEALTGREQEVLALLAVGRSNRDIGHQLFISAKTVSVHVSNILAKLGAAGRTEAVAIARSRRLIRDDPQR